MPTPTASPTPAFTGLLVRVRDIETRQPIVGAAVSVQVFEARLSSFTGANGEVLFGGPPGTYTIFVSKDGYAHLDDRAKEFGIQGPTVVQGQILTWVVYLRRV